MSEPARSAVVRLCGYIDLTTRAPACFAPAAYLAFYANCRECGPKCEGAPVCLEHGADERRNPDLIRLVDA